MSSYTTTEARWKALTVRDPASEHAFIYSVVTTKIYCLPTCPSRLARRANIVFYSTPIEAESAGYRPCLRCRPAAPGSNPQKVAVAKAKRLLDTEGVQKLGLRELAREVGMTESHFCRVFKKATGFTIGTYRKGVKESATLMGESEMKTPERTGDRSIALCDDGCVVLSNTWSEDGKFSLRDGIGPSEKTYNDLSEADDGMQFVDFEACGVFI